MPGPGVSRDQIADKNDEAGSNQTLAIVGFAIGGVGLAAGVTLLILDMDKGDSSTARGVRVCEPPAPVTVPPTPPGAPLFVDGLLQLPVAATSVTNTAVRERFIGPQSNRARKLSPSLTPRS
jgi:hypothetical protein